MIPTAGGPPLAVGSSPIILVGYSQSDNGSKVMKR